MERQRRRATAYDFRGFLRKSMQFVIHDGLTIMAYQIDIPNDGACLFTSLAYYAWYCEHHSLPKPPMLTTDSMVNREHLCDFLQVNAQSPMIADELNELTVHQYFLANYGPQAVYRKAVHRSNQSHDVVFVETFGQYIELMRDPVAHADELFVWAASRMYNIRLSLLEQFVPRIVDPNLRYLVEKMGYSRAAAENALQQCSGNLEGAVLEGAVDYLVQNPPQSSESDVVWREDVHNEAGAFKVCITRAADTARHFRLVLPRYAPIELEPTLPPRTRKYIVAAQQMWQECPKSSASGGAAAAVPAQSSPFSRKPSASGGRCETAASQPSFGNDRQRILSTKEMWEAANGKCAAVFSADSAPSSSKSFASGGAAADVSHQSPSSFVHAQPSIDSPFVISARSLCDSIFLTTDGFFRAIQKIVEERGECPERFQVIGLKIPSSCAKSIQLFGSFPVLKDDKTYYPYRVMIFMFDDGSVLPYDGSVDDLSDPNNKTAFSETVKKYWRDGNRVLTGIQFERCALKSIPRK